MQTKGDNGPVFALELSSNAEIFDIIELPESTFDQLEYPNRNDDHQKQDADWLMLASNQIALGNHQTDLTNILQVKVYRF